MKIALISAFLPPTRAPEADYAIYLARALAQRATVEIVTARQAQTAHIPGVRVHDCAGRWSWRDLPRLVWTLRRLKPDAIVLSYIGWGFDHHPMITFLPLFFPDVRFVTLFHNVHGASTSKLGLRGRLVHRFLRKWAGARDTGHLHGMLPGSDLVVILNEAHRATLSPRAVFVPAMPLITRAAGAASRAEFGLPDEGFVFAFFGYVYPTKGVDTLLRAFHEVSRKRPSARLLMIGGEIDPRGLTEPELPRLLRDSLAALDIIDKVKFTGGYEWDSELPSRALAVSDACVLPFDGGAGTHNSSIAAVVSHGVPLLSTQGAATVEFPDGALLCPPRDPTALAEAMERVMTDGTLRERLRRNASALARETFCASKVTRRLLDAIELRG